jgi:hypothetical protein
VDQVVWYRDGQLGPKYIDRHIDMTDQGILKYLIAHQYSILLAKKGAPA